MCPQEGPVKGGGVPGSRDQGRVCKEGARDLVVLDLDPDTLGETTCPQDR